MCFSATASFTASATLGVIGVATLVKTKNKKAWPLAAIPLLFAFQQFVEGLLWVLLGSQSVYIVPLTHIYLFFALLFWPIYTPIAVLVLEPHKIRRLVLAIFCVVGVVIGAIFFVSFLRQPEAVQVVNKCLFYPFQMIDPLLFGCLYVLIVVGSGVISSRPIIKLLSLLTLVGALVAWFFYTVNFVSVWCFFAAIISVVLYFYPQKS